MSLDRARLLLEQARFDLAIQELRQVLAADPNHAHAHALLSIALTETRQHQLALEEAQQAIALAPDESFHFYVMARVLHHRDEEKEAESAVKEAIRLAPWHAPNYALLASIYLSLRRWQDALTAAEQGLALDPEHTGCANLRAMALTKLGRRIESLDTLRSALHRDPTNAFTHATQGWSLLEARQPEQAMQHFREALRLEPNLEYARAGIVEALKARNILYRWILHYFFWMSRLPDQARWFIIIGGYALSRFLRGPLFWLYVLFAYLTWTAPSLFNLLLRLDSFGRLALSEQQIRTSNYVGAALAVGLLGLVLWLTGIGSGLLLLLYGALMVIPLSATFNRAAGRGRTILTVYTAVLALIGAVGLFFAAFPTQFSSGDPFLPWFFWGVFIFTWVANFVR
jgi:tetratricopeptide (TPR) repeat protein